MVDDRTRPDGNRATILPFPRETVVLLHGMLAGRRSMRRIERILVTEGYRVLNWGYPSLAGSITRHADRLGRLLEGLDRDAGTTAIHAVTHSMGGAILRCALRRRTPEKTGRIVMLAPPNAGSRLASLPLGPFRRWFPQIAELSTAADSLVNRLPEPADFQVGVIAAGNDFVVDVDSTRLRCQHDHLVLASTHQKLPVRAETSRQVLSFLRGGRFVVSQPAPAPRVPLLDVA